MRLRMGRFWRNRSFQLIIFLLLTILVLYMTDIGPTLEVSEDSVRLSWNAEAVDRVKVEALVDDNVDKLVGMRSEHVCKIPRTDPFDKEILPLIKHPRSTDCAVVQPDMAYVDADGVLHLNTTAVTEYEKQGSTTVYCQYKYFDRGSTDREVIYKDPVQLTESVTMEMNFVKVSCFEGGKGPNGTKIYTNAFAYPKPLAKGTGKALFDDGDDMSVFILCLEGVSTAMAHRHLPQTMEYLTGTGALIFDSFSEVGENSIQNLAAMFTGKRAEYEQTDMPAELPSPKDGFHDGWPVIWKRFQQEKDYETVFLEDSTKVSSFHYNAAGFKHAPTHYWYFPYWNQMELLGDPISKSSQFCYGNDPSYEIFGQLLYRHLDKSQNHRLFFFSKYNHLSHDFTSDIERSDETWHALLRRLDSDAILKRTVLIVMGDHGPRFTSTRRTVAGFTEERLPLFAIRLPPVLYDKYPKLRDILKSNQNRLTSMFDVHETLLDILNEKYDGSPKSHSSKGVSVLRPIPPDRTCAQAGVPNRYCLCNGYSVKSVQDPLALKAAQLVNEEVNKRAKDYKYECARTKVSQIEYFIKIPWPKQDESKTKYYFVAFNTEPRNVVFEGVVIRSVTDDTMTYKSGTLERLNPLSSKICVANPNVWKFCACKEGL